MLCFAVVDVGDETLYEIGLAWGMERPVVALCGEYLGDDERMLGVR